MKDYERLTERGDYYLSAKTLMQKKLNRLTWLENTIECGEIDYVADKDAEIARLTAENERLRDEMSGLLRLIGDKASVYAAQRIKELESENKRLREKLKEQKDRIEYEHDSQMEWFRQACNYKADCDNLRERLKKYSHLD